MILQSPYRLNQHSHRIILFISFLSLSLSLCFSLCFWARIGLDHIVISTVFVLHSQILRWNFVLRFEAQRTHRKIGFINAAKLCAIIHHFQWLANCERCDKVYFSFDCKSVGIRYLVSDIWPIILRQNIEEYTNKKKKNGPPRIII